MLTFAIGDSYQLSLKISAEELGANDEFVLNGKHSGSNGACEYDGIFEDGTFGVGKANQSPNAPVCRLKIGEFTYEGQMMEGKRHGQGTLTLGDCKIENVDLKGTVLKGEWKSDLPVGPVTGEVWNNGSKKGALSIKVEGTSFSKGFAAFCGGGGGGGLPSRFIENLPRTPRVGYDGKFNMDWSLYGSKKDWPVHMSVELPNLHARMMQFVERQTGALTLPSVPKHRREEFLPKEKPDFAFKVRHNYNKH